MGKLRMEDQRIERLIREHLIRGFSLLQKKPCPACRTPLVRQEDTTSSKNEDWPIPGIAYCVKCDAHVVSQVSEVNILDAYEKKQKNTSFYVASQSSNSSWKQPSKKAGASSDESCSGILERSRESITDTQKAQAHKAPKRRVATQPSVPGSLIVDPILEDRRREQPKIVMPSAPTLVEPPNWWKTQQANIQRAYQALVETTSDISANSGIRIHEGIVVASKPSRPAEPAGYVVDGTDVVSTDESSKGHRDPPLEDATLRTEDHSSRHSSQGDASSVHDPPPRFVVKAKSFYEEPKREKPKDPSEKTQNQTDPPLVPSGDKGKEKQRDTMSQQETPKYKNTIKSTFEKPSFRERPPMLATVNSADDSIDDIKKEEKDSVDDNPNEEIDSLDDTPKEEEEKVDDVMSRGTLLSLDEFAAAAPRVSLHPRETALTEQISGHNKDILRESERLEHLQRMKEESIQNEVPIDIQNEIAKGIEEAMKARVKAEAKVQKLQQERSKVEADRIISFLEDELKEKQIEAIFAEKLAKDAYERLSKARKEVALSLEAEVPRDEDYQTVEDSHASHHSTEQVSINKDTDEDDPASHEPWDVLREEGRSALTRRLMAGWHVSNDHCNGVECHQFPLLSHDGHSYCAVCGGSGNGVDGAYDINLRDESTIKSRKSEESSMKKTPKEEQTVKSEGNSTRKIANDGQASSVATKSLKAIQDEFDAKRKLASKEIGAKMRQGWMLLDMTCQSCMMPLLTDMSQDCVLCVLCGVQSGHLDHSTTLMEKESEEFHEESATSRHSEPRSARSKRSIHFEDVSQDEVVGGSANHEPYYCDSPNSAPSASSVVALSNRTDPPPARNYSEQYSRRPLSPHGRRPDEYFTRATDRTPIPGSHHQRRASEVIVVEDAESFMSERRHKPHYTPSRSQYSMRHQHMKHISPSWDSGRHGHASRERRSSSPTFSVASAPQYGNPSILVADSPKMHRHYPRRSFGNNKSANRFEPELVSLRSNHLSRQHYSSRHSHSGHHRLEGSSSHSVASSRSYHHRAPSPGLSAAVLPSAASSVYTGTSRSGHKSGAVSSVYTGTSRSTRKKSGTGTKSVHYSQQPRMYPEKWVGPAVKQGRSHRTNSRKAIGEDESFRPIRPTAAVPHGSNVIDVEPIRRWQEGREDIIIVGTRTRQDEAPDEQKGLDDLLSRIEKTKSQIEERSQSPAASRDTQFKGLVENLARSVQQLREIERR